jgi:hypothetical protein
MASRRRRTPAAMPLRVAAAGPAVNGGRGDRCVAGVLPVLGRPGKEVAAATGMLGPFVWLPLHGFRDDETGGLERRDHVARHEESKIEGDSVAPELIAVERVTADVKGNKEDAARGQDPAKLTQSDSEVLTLEVDEGVERDDACQRSVREIERAHVSDPKCEARVEPRGPTDHLGRKVDTEDLSALLVEVACDVARTATEVARDAAVADLLGEAVQEVAIERLLCELPVDVLDVSGGDRVVACAKGICGIGRSRRGGGPHDETASSHESCIV